MKFFHYIIYLREIHIKKKQIIVIRDKLKLQLVRVIYVFFRFSIFCICFIKHFSKIVALIISILKITKKIVIN